MDGCIVAVGRDTGIHWHILASDWYRVGWNGRSGCHIECIANDVAASDALLSAGWDALSGPVDACSISSELLPHHSSSSSPPPPPLPRPPPPSPPCRYVHRHHYLCHHSLRPHPLPNADHRRGLGLLHTYLDMPTPLARPVVPAPTRATVHALHMHTPACMGWEYCALVPRAHSAASPHVLPFALLPGLSLCSPLNPSLLLLTPHFIPPLLILLLAHPLLPTPPLHHHFFVSRPLVFPSSTTSDSPLTDWPSPIATVT
ncbi:hypothetical protein CDD80_1155 [Ophiocordyceps camponoti-rufipedis]|uniref:Uncharacterized protein n=1 Tax=Ophiocordyceps camponoti-rufipedis TaxID=2004952 RepID=A0A2C5ZA11_9HYPO|nr:hypothetical protein CDD80_1155 [Ophiocordyceps camponoti-rufipedis]